MFIASSRRLPLLLLLAACSAPDRGRSVEEFPAVPPAEWSTIGESIDGRAVLAKTCGAGPRRIYLIAGIHGDERPAVENADRLTVLVETNLPPGVTVRIVRDANPDGTAARTRTNVRAVDLNRNWPAKNFTPHRSRGPRPLSEPESRAVHGDLLRFDPELVVVLHAARGGPFVNYDGPAREVAARFALGAASFDSRWHVLADMGYATPGSLGSWVGVDMQIPILTVEMKRGEPAVDVWPALRAGFLAVMGAQPPSTYELE